MGIFDNFTGGRSRDDFAVGTAQANQALQRGFNDFRDTENQFLDRSLGQIQPSIDAGDLARDNQLVALGLKGLEAQRDFFSNFQTDPGFTEALDRSLDVINTRANATGRSLSGGNLRDLTQFATGQFLNQAFQNRLDRLTQLSQLGSAARGDAAGLTSGAGARIGGARLGQAQAEANNALAQAGATAQTRDTGINNLLKLINAGSQLVSSAGSLGTGIGNVGKGFGLGGAGTPVG